MKLFLLKNKGVDLEAAAGGYDQVESFVIRASSAAKARKQASKERGDEGAEVWLIPRLSSCKRISEEGKEENLIRDYRAG